MEFPLEIRLEIENQLKGIKQKELVEISKQITHRYHHESGQGKRLVVQPKEALVYSIVRMPATFGAVDFILQQLKSSVQLEFDSLLDVGAGTGAAFVAASAHYSFNKKTALEREKNMRILGEAFIKNGPKYIEDVCYQNFDFIKDKLDQKASMVIESYMLNELDDDKQNQAIVSLWQASESILILVEPGTKEGFKVIKKARDLLIKEGAYLLAPCQSQKPCLLDQDDWCHFSARIARSKLHKMIKEGDVPYEDEKFSYLIASRVNHQKESFRVVRHPYITKGTIDLTLCHNGEVEVKKIKKKDPLYKQARKIKWGEAIEKD